MTRAKLERRLSLLLPTEEQEQVALAQWLDLMRLRWCHVPNDGARHKATAGKLRALGVKAGVPDILIFDRPTACEEDGRTRHTMIAWPKDVQHHCALHAPGVAIELKRRGLTGSSISAAQKDWILALRAREWIVRACFGAEEAIAFLTKLGYGRRS